MEFIGSWLDNIMGAVSLFPQLLQFFMSCCGSIPGLLAPIVSIPGLCSPLLSLCTGSTGYMACILAIGSQCINAIHCIELGGLSLERLIAPVFEKMGEEIGGVFAK